MFLFYRPLTFLSVSITLLRKSGLPNETDTHPPHRNTDRRFVFYPIPNRLTSTDWRTFTAPETVSWRPENVISVGTAVTAVNANNVHRTVTGAVRRDMQTTSEAMTILLTLPTRKVGTGPARSGNYSATDGQ